jgi:multiple sugar transport system substrate-binding protein
VGGKVGTVAPPSGDEGRFTHIHGLGLGLNKAAQNKEGAVRFLNWLATPEAMQAYALAGGAPALSKDALQPVVEQRPDLTQLGDYAGQYGFVMTGATSAGALPVYELQAQHFTGYWAGQESLDEALSATADGMAELLK